jgi:hypothetical protein
VTEGEKPRPVQEKEDSYRGQLELFAGGDAHGHCGTRRDLLVQAGLADHVSHAIGLGCDIRYAPRLVHSDDLDSPASPHRPGLQARRAVNGETPACDQREADGQVGTDSNRLGRADRLHAPRATEVLFGLSRQETYKPSASTPKKRLTVTDISP